MNPGELPRRLGRRFRDRRLLLRSPLFNAGWYRAHNKDVAGYGRDPAAHYLQYGAAEGRDPGPRFSTRGYLEANPDVAAAGLNPLIHYLRHGAAEGRAIVPPMAPDPVGPSTAADAAPLAEPASPAPPASPGPPSAPAAPSVPAEPSAPPAPAWTPIERSTLPPVHLSGPQVDRRAGALSIGAMLGEATPLQIAIRGPASVLERIEPRLEPFLPMALLVAASAGRDVVVDGTLDQTYLTTLRLTYLPMLRRLFAVPVIDLQVAGAVLPDRGVALRPAPGQPPGPAALTFSGGIDSLYSYLRLREVGAPLELLVNVHAGAHDDDRACMARRFERVARFAAETGLEAVLVDTNLHRLLEIPHLNIWIQRNLSAAYALVGAANGLVSSTSRSWQELDWRFVPEYIGHAGTVVSASFAWERMPVTELGYEATRYQKLARIAAEPLSERYLDVCTDQPYQAAASSSDPVNCGACAKCLWVMSVLHGLGRLDRYRSQFPVDRYDELIPAIEASLASRRATGRAVSMEPEPDPVPTVAIVPPARI